MRAIDRLSRPQRVVVVIALGLVLALVGSYLMSLGGGANGWYAYSPLTASAYAPGLPAWLRLISWLALTGVWALASIRVLRPAPDRSAPAAGPRGGPPAESAREAGSDPGQDAAAR
jgi:hypothetical protein